MNATLRITLMPQYMRRFACVGGECEDTCCIGWRVNIDQETYKKYRRVRHPELSPLFEKAVNRNRSNPSPGNYAKIRLRTDGACPFLTEERLCRIQLSLGEEYLSDTCYTYPRTYNEVNGVIEKSATLSCPEAARLALLNPAVMEFDRLEEPLARPGTVKAVLHTGAPRWASQPQRYFWDLRVFAVDILQNRTCSLEDRLILLGMFCRKLKEYVDSGRVKEVPALIDTYNRAVADGAIRESLASIPAQSTIQMKLLKELADQRFPFVVKSARYLQCFAECLHGLQYTQEAKVEEIGERYAGAYADYYRPFMDEHGYILEHYLVNHVFKNLFPFDRKTVFDAYIMLVVHYALIKLILIGMSAYHQGLTPELVVKLIQSFSKTVEHNTTYLDRVLELLHANGYDTMAWTAVMVRN